METKPTETTTATSDAPKAASPDLRTQLAAMTLDQVFGGSEPPQAGDLAPASDASPDASESTKDEDQSQGQDTQNDAENEPKSKRQTKAESRAAEEWKRIEAEKTRIAAEEARLLKERSEFEAKAASVRDAVSSATTVAADYERMAKEWDAEGRTDLAAVARQRAEKLQREAVELKQQANQAQFKEAQNAVLKQVIAEHPDLTKQDSQLFKDMDALLKAKPVLLSYPEGIRDAVEFINSKRAAEKATALEKELAAVKQKLAEREKLLQPSTGRQTSAASGEVDFLGLSSEERTRRIKASLRAAEEAGVTVL